MISAMGDLNIHLINYYYFSLSLCCCSCRDTHQLFFDYHHLWMHHHPVWLTEVVEDLFVTPFTQLYQSTRMMTLHRNNHHRTQWIEEKRDLTLQMIRFYWMLHHPVSLIEVEEDLFLTSFYQLYQSKRMMMPLHCHSNNHWNNTDQTQWIQEKWDLTLQMIRFYGMLHHPVSLIEVEEDLFLTSFYQLYQSTRMMMPNRNTHDQSQWIEEQGDF